jgi:enediyne biosynthesis protein E4
MKTMFYYVGTTWTPGSFFKARQAEQSRRTGLAESSQRTPHNLHDAGVGGYALFGCLLLTIVTMAAHAGDQFVQVTNPGWTNSSQYSWTGAWGDYDHDGLIDLFVPNTTSSWDIWANFLYHNNGNGTFTQKTAADVGPVAGDEDRSIGGYWGDINNDGLLDLFVLNMIPSPDSPPIVNRLYLNCGDGTFASADGGDLTLPCLAYAWGGLADYDNDGWLDVLVCSAGASSDCRTNLLYHGRGDGTFSLVTDNGVVTDQVNYSNDAAWGDFNNDRRLDLIVANAGGSDFFYRNDGHGQFTRLTNSVLEQSGYSSYHHAWGDYDNDGFLDVAMGGPSCMVLFRNDGQGDFLEVANWPDAGGGSSVWVDYDNDGYLDLLVIRGQSSKSQLYLLHNNGNGEFNQVEESFTLPFANWIGGAWGDYDNDGFMDLFLAEIAGENALYRNLGNANHWIKFRLEGRVSNRAAIGAKVRIKTTIGGKTFWQMREVTGGDFCQNDLRPNFGLGDATNVDQVRIEWPSGIVQTLTNVMANQFLEIVEHQEYGGQRPAITEVGASTNGFRLMVQEPAAGAQYALEGSTNLVRWTMLLSRTSTGGTQEFTDASTKNYPAHFYRVVVP